MEDKLTNREIDREIDLESKGIIYDKELTNIKKKSFINEIKLGLGDDIKSNPNAVKFIKESKSKKISDFIKKLFKKF